MFIKNKISTGIQCSVDQHDKVKALLKATDEQFQTSDETLASTLIMKFSSLRLTSVRSVCEHIMQMRDIVTQLKTLEVEMFESFLVHYILNTFPQQLLTMCVQEVWRLVMEIGENALFAKQGNNQNQAKKKKKKGKVKYCPNEK